MKPSSSLLLFRLVLCLLSAGLGWGALTLVDGDATTASASSAEVVNTVSSTLYIPLVARDYLPASGRLCRFGVGATSDIASYDVNVLRLGWYIDWKTTVAAAAPGDIDYLPMIRLKQTGTNTYSFSPSQVTIAQVAAEHPGMIWLVGNEPDRRVYQDDLEPQVYARAYHDLYALIKVADPTAQIAAGGIVQPTPLRLQYLDLVLQSYQDTYGESMPVDVWNIHAFILRERSCTAYPDDCWGADVPPGVDADEGMLYTIDDNGSIEIFKENIEAFRQWMADRGYQERPLIITEFGIQMTPNLGFPPERVNTFMDATFDYLSTMTNTLGYSVDDYRLVQRWAWYSLNDANFNGWLFDASTKDSTVFGDNFAAYTSQVEAFVNLKPVTVLTEVVGLLLPDEPMTLTLQATVVNNGNIGTSNPLSVAFYDGDPEQGGIYIGTGESALLDGCASSTLVEVTWTSVVTGAHTVFVVADSEYEIIESDELDNSYSIVVWVE